jgi:hypothetical protein
MIGSDFEADGSAALVKTNKSAEKLIKTTVAITTPLNAKEGEGAQPFCFSLASIFDFKKRFMDSIGHASA